MMYDPKTEPEQNDGSSDEGPSCDSRADELRLPGMNTLENIADSAGESSIGSAASSLYHRLFR